MSRPQRDLELEAAVGIAQLAAEQILHPSSTWRSRYRTVCGCTCTCYATSLALQPCWSRASNVSASRSCWPGRRRCSGASRAARKAPASSSSEKIGEDEQGGQVLVAAHQVLAAADDAPGGEAERQPRPAQRRGA
jgi:hypothetical protein